MESKILDTLEFSKVISDLAAFAGSEKTVEKIRGLLPSTKIEDVKRAQDETEDGVTLLKREDGIPVARFNDIRPHLKRLSIGASLDGEEISHILKVLVVGHEMIDYFEKIKDDEEIELHVVYAIVERIQVFSNLVKHIRSVINDSGEILDDASPALRTIRNTIRQSQSQIRTQLARFTKGSQSKYLTENIVTMRNDRYVLPVKAESRGQVKGVIHDQSASGQTVFIEPQNVVNLNNKLRQLQAEEREEIERILAEISAHLADHIPELENNLEVLTQLDFINAKARYAQSINAVRVEISEENHINFLQARHPLIAEDEIIPNDIYLGEDYKTVIITGPNTGGKTIVLKTLGLLQLMGQAGLQLPVAEESQMGLFDGIYADIGDEQSIEQSLSTFSSHMVTIIDNLKKITPKSLVLFDELGAGTDPQEGAALAISILDYVRQVGSYAMITSHYPELKAYGFNSYETVNASMEFDIETLEPTYRLAIGVPGRSNAFEISKRLGLPGEIIDHARELMSGESQNVNDMIEDLDAQRKNAEAEYEAFQENHKEARLIRRRLEIAHEAFKKEKEEMMVKARAEANQRVEKIEKEAERVIEELRDKQLQSGHSEAIKEHEFIDARTRLGTLRSEEEKEALQKNKVLQKAKETEKLHEGEDVLVSTLGQTGTLIEQTSDNEWMVQLGSLRMKVEERNLEKIESKEEEKKPPKRVQRSSTKTVRTELNLIGERYEDAMAKLDNYLDSALLNNHVSVRLIHGDGTGALREGVHQKLKRHPQVEDFNLAPANQGGTGVTIVNFKE